MKSRRIFSAALLALALTARGASLPATNMTAFALAKEGNKFISAQARDKITAIHSEKSTGGLVPEIWHVEYYDSAAAFKTTEVKFVAGQMKEITRPKHLLDSFSGGKQLEWRKTKIDSDRALGLALKEPMLNKLDLRATQFWLERTAVGSTWKIQFWAARPGKPDQTISIGDLYLSSKTGAVLKNDLQIRGTH